MTTQDKIQGPLEMLMAQEPYRHFFKPHNSQRVGEFNLRGEGITFRADACYEVATGGNLFVEHDNAQTGLNNLAKYWFLIEKGRLRNDIFLIHIIDDKRPAAKKLCEFIGQQFIAGTKARYFLRVVNDWHNSEWRDRLVEVLDEIIKELTSQGIKRAVEDK